MKYYQQYDRQKQIFSIRKFSFGAGSVVLSTLLYLGMTQTASAAEETTGGEVSSATEDVSTTETPASEPTETMSEEAPAVVEPGIR
ncbi:MAG: YSIRK-type signal peptide-containing protein [Staphylococcus rostri]|uniref:YSIRK-type signal peptide-containing protein n=1 Tax=Staphylococcus rostri TaxID=522262 RepID=UPI0026DEE221|nr:YSIRK-type signal peptide-containing protein [Staphylococcus rostri]MDO5376666.1 YSIRK-type signal peptide-containing protein [Staphylococcus rostri]